MVRFFHISDIHVALPHPGWTPRDFFSKHTTGWVNWNLLGRGKRFQNARPILEQFAARVRAERPDAIIFSGDATALGFAAEASEAARILNVKDTPGITIPGNHDHYTKAAVRQCRFEDAFRPWLEGVRVGDATYPFARNFNGIWLVAVNSSVPNFAIRDARGRVGEDQLSRLDALLTSLPAGPRVLVTHYPLVTAEGAVEPNHHLLRDREQLAAIVKRHGIKTWLCGHRHHPYQFGPTPDVPFHIICAGSSTMIGTAGYEEVLIDSEGVASSVRHPLSV